MTEEVRDILDHKIEKISKYKNGDKFVVEIMESGYPYSVIGERRNCSEEFLDSLDRLDSDYINEHFGELQDEAYNQGLNDGFELANKIWDEFNIHELEDIFEYNYPRGVIDNFTPQEALAKLKAYEEAQNKIEVGDVVEITHCDEKFKGLVLDILDEISFVLLTENGMVESYVDERVKKTGKHIDISSILEQIGE